MPMTIAAARRIPAIVSCVLPLYGSNGNGLVTLLDVADVEEVLGRTGTAGRADELVGVGAEPDAARFLDATPSDADRVAAQHQHRRARRQLRAAGRPSCPRLRRGSRPATSAMRMPAARIMSSVEMSSALRARQRGDLRREPGLRQRDRASADQIEPVERAAPAAPGARFSASAMSRGAVWRARSAAASRSRPRPARTASRAGRAAGADRASPSAG